MYDDLVSRIIKYVFEGLGVAVVAYLVPKKKMEYEEIAIIALTATFCFAILDMWSPTTASAMRSGAGFGAGLRLTGGI